MMNDDDTTEMAMELQEYLSKIRMSTEDQEYLRQNLPVEFQKYLCQPNGVELLLRELPPLAHLSAPHLAPEHKTWEAAGLFYRYNQRFSEALAIYSKLYDYLLAAQEVANARYPKGTPLVWMSECFAGMGCTAIAKRYLMLTLVEDAISGHGAVSPTHTGVYFRMVWRGWLSDADLKRYASEIYQLFERSPEAALYPEWVLQQLDREWITQAPTPQEAGVFAPNLRYIRHMIGSLGDPSGKMLESLADYLMSCMPGCRTMKRKHTPSTDHDLICSIEGLELDFRSEFGRYFVCECKDRAGPAGFTAMAKFCRVLDSVKSRFGILFSRKGISGTGTHRDAALEQLKVFQDRGTVIVVVDQEDLDRVAQGTNFISLLRTKYEKVRLNLTDDPKATTRKRVNRRKPPGETGG
jgi:hypothetical protein